MSYRELHLNLPEIPTLEDAVYEDSARAFDTKRGRLLDAATAAHEAGNEADAQRLLDQANAMVNTGLYWQEDNA